MDKGKRERIRLGAYNMDGGKIERIRLEAYNMDIGMVLFDLDGTLTDSGPGIMNSVQYALRKCHMEVADVSALHCFIGPPLAQQFQKFCHFSEEESFRAVEYYREYYVEKGIFENRVYDGVPDLLKALKKAGKQIVMATSKPEKFARQIAEHFQLAEYFDFIGGSLMDGGRADKSEVIEYVLGACSHTERAKVLMVGDRDYDVFGAKAAKVHSMGVLYGYGSKTELESAGADYIVSTPYEARDCICGAEE